MTWLVAAILVIFVAGVAISAVVAILVGIAKTLGEVTEEAAKGGATAYRRATNVVINVLGRASRDSGLVIPSILATPFSEKASIEADLLSLQEWKPVPVPVVPAGRRQFESLLVRPALTSSDKITTDEISTMLPTGDHPRIGNLYDTAETRLAYPVAKLSEPRSIAPPPRVPNVSLSFKPAAIDLPFYDGRWSILNPLVRTAHRKDLAAFAQAEGRRIELEEWVTRINPQIEEAQLKARARWEVMAKRQKDDFHECVNSWEMEKNEYEQLARAELNELNEIRQRYEQAEKEATERYFYLALQCVVLPPAIPRERRLSFDVDSKILVVEHGFPDVHSTGIEKWVHLKKGSQLRPVSDKERSHWTKVLQAALCLRLLKELFSADRMARLDAIAVNCVVRYIDKSLGQPKSAYCASLFARRAEFEKLNLGAVDPVAASKGLGGAHAGDAFDLSPVDPVLRLRDDDPRFIEGREILNTLRARANLAAMEWDDFEHLIRELFEKAFAEHGATVHVTRASRDQGVDAIILDPDPLRGGKIIIQAKRYTNLVPLSAVRELYGAVINEGASRGILVTTSHYGPDAHQFAAEKPLVLMNGEQLLGLLQKYGYEFRIDLEEAKRLQRMQI